MAFVMNKLYVLRIQADLEVVHILFCQLNLVMSYDVISSYYRLLTILADDIAILIQSFMLYLIKKLLPLFAVIE
jgi:hypothetical protein